MQTFIGKDENARNIYEQLCQKELLFGIEAKLYYVKMFANYGWYEDENKKTNRSFK
jgi:hypothetical protein